MKKNENLSNYRLRFRHVRYCISTSGAQCIRLKNRIGLYIWIRFCTPKFAECFGGSKQFLQSILHEGLSHFSTVWVQKLGDLICPLPQIKFSQFYLGGKYPSHRFCNYQFLVGDSALRLHFFSKVSFAQFSHNLEVLLNFWPHLENKIVIFVPTMKFWMLDNKNTNCRLSWSLNA